MQILERDPDWVALATPTITIYWIKRLGEVVIDRGSTVLPSSTYRDLNPDGRISWFENRKALLYGALQTSGEFPAGDIT